MAITSTITDNVPSAQQPANHTPNSYTPLSGTKFKTNGSTTIAATGNTNANANTAFANILTAVKTYVDGTFLPSTVKLDTAQSITAVIFVSSVQVDGESSIYTSDTKNFDVDFSVEWQ